MRLVATSLASLVLGAHAAFEIRAATPLDWKNEAGHRVAELNVPAQGRPGFTLAGPETGVVFTNVLGIERYTTNSNILNGSGVAAGDVDGDGWPDLFFAGLDSPNALYRNLGDWRFEDIAERAGVAMQDLDCTGAALADLDGDGDLDLAVNTFGRGTRLFENDGKGRFRAGPVLNPGTAGMSLALADIDGDSDLDLYIANYRVVTVRDEPESKIEGEHVRGRMVMKTYNGRSMSEPDLVGRFTFGPNGRLVEHGEVDMLYRNDGAWKFTHAPFESSAFRDENGQPLASVPRDWGLTCAFRDLTGDGAPDLYVCNDFESPDRLWQNDGTGRFFPMSAAAVRHTCYFSMGVDFADVNRDGFDDFFVADMLSRAHTEHNTRDRIPYSPSPLDARAQFSNNQLFVNRGDGTYAEIGWFAGVEASGWTWSPVFLDVDLDGWQDLLLTTGNQHDSIDLDVMNHANSMKARQNLTRRQMLELRLLFKPLASPKLAFRNLGNLRFEEHSAAWGFHEAGFSQGIALADLDMDGDLDAAVNNMNARASLYRNEATAGRVAVRLRGAKANTRGIGAKIQLIGPAGLQQQEMQAGGRYLSSDDPARAFAASGEGARLVVTWRSGKRTTLENVRANRLYEIFEEGAEGAGNAGAAPGAESGAASSGGTWFEDMSAKLSHQHGDEPFDDFGRQPLLPFRLSQNGPGVTWHDFDQDGWDDLVLPSGRGGKLSLLRNDQQGGFSSLNEPYLQRPVARDQTTAIGIGKVLLIGSSNYEDGMTNGGWIRIVDVERKAGGESILGPEAACGPLAAADVDGDGLLELFIGGRAIAGRYPEAATSILFRNEASRFVPKQRFEKLSRVSGAVFSDLDADGDPDLALACHYDSVRVFRNDRGTFTEITKEAGLDGLKGLWSGIATGDLDHDGRPDLIASNWGLNTPLRASAGNPVNVYFADLDGNNVLDVVEAAFDPDLKKEVPLRTLKSVGPALPYVQEKMPSYLAYGRGSIDEIFGPKIRQAPMVSVNTLESMVFFNRGGRFEAKPLPAEAQFSPAFGVAVADFNGDGHDDALLAQNFFAGNPETPRFDAGRGLILTGDGRGNLAPIAGQVSGIRAYGEQRGCALADYDQDGRIDIVLAQNGAGTKLYRNTAGPAGVRVRLSGPPSNPAAVGATLRLAAKSGLILREVQSGSGYWSVNSPVQVLHGDGELTVRFPDGKTVKTEVTADLKEIRIAASGEVQPVKK